MRATPDQVFDRYGVSPHQGMLPQVPPVRRLSDYYAHWETLAADLPTLIAKQQVRTKIDGLPVLDTSALIHKAEWQRAFSLLGFLTQAYIWSANPPAEVCLVNTIWDNCSS